MLSSAACLRGLSLLHESRGDPITYREAMKMLLTSVRYQSGFIDFMTDDRLTSKTTREKHK